MGLRSTAEMWLRDLAGVIWPRTCAICGRTLVDGEDALCLNCLSNIPLTQLHRTEFNSIHQRLAADVRIERAGAMMKYVRRGAYSGLIRRGKYNDRPDLLRSLSYLYASQLLADNFFEGIDLIIPVPMHKWKKLKRGYNQSEVIAEALSGATGIAVGDNLVALHGHKTQTRQGTFDRHNNVSSLFDVMHPEELAGKHILLVDDVITSGATLHACAKTLTDSVAALRLSILTLATATD
ncbi:MAG: ComF family protein [Muribaculaceae bacterium]|nr:ComF family protein [Muribaculaceae bacterium]